MTTEISLSELARVEDGKVSIASLRAANVITHGIKRVKIVSSGKIDKAVSVSGVAVTKGAKQAIEAAGGKVEA